MQREPGPQRHAHSNSSRPGWSCSGRAGLAVARGGVPVPRRGFAVARGRFAVPRRGFTITRGGVAISMSGLPVLQRVHAIAGGLPHVPRVRIVVFIRDCELVPYSSRDIPTPGGAIALIGERVALVRKSVALLALRALVRRCVVLAALHRTNAKAPVRSLATASVL
jgi:hypothetical protein